MGVYGALQPFNLSWQDIYQPHVDPKRDKFEVFGALYPPDLSPQAKGEGKCHLPDHDLGHQGLGFDAHGHLPGTREG